MRLSSDQENYEIFVESFGASAFNHSDEQYESKLDQNAYQKLVLLSKQNKYAKRFLANINLNGGIELSYSEQVFDYFTSRVIAQQQQYAYQLYHEMIADGDVYGLFKVGTIYESLYAAFRLAINDPCAVEAKHYIVALSEDKQNALLTQDIAEILLAILNNDFKKLMQKQCFWKNTFNDVIQNVSKICKEEFGENNQIKNLMLPVISTSFTKNGFFQSKSNEHLALLLQSATREQQNISILGGIKN